MRKNGFQRPELVQVADRVHFRYTRTAQAAAVRRANSVKLVAAPR